MHVYILVMPAWNMSRIEHEYLVTIKALSKEVDGWKRRRPHG